jgi:biotin transport system substrate-specific component
MLTNATVADIYRPGEKTLALLYDIALILCGSVLIGLSANIKIGGPVPITLQTFAVLIVAMLFGSKRGSLTILAYLGEGLAGLPFFTAGGGLTAFSGFTGGFLVGFAPAAYIAGLLAEKGWDRKSHTTILAMIIGNLIIYIFGYSWFAYLTNPAFALKMGIYPFIVGDLIKIAFAAALLPGGWKVLGYFRPAE